MKKCCPCHAPIGGPSHTDETCKSCSKEWTRYRGGSWDWQYEDCGSCKAKEFVSKMKPEDIQAIRDSIKKNEK